MNKVLILLTFCSSCLCAKAQNSNTIRGSVADTSLNIRLAYTTAMVLNSADSILVDFTTTGTAGSFIVDSLPSGNFILLLIRTGYADYVERFNLSSMNPVKDFGQISLIQKARLLQEVLINGTRAIKLKGDTTEFNASSYKIQPNDRVEDLLKQLPGIEVDQNGRITARGRPVQKVLVDGEEFFGDDPMLVTRNIRADMVDKVQLFEKKSDQAAFTGIDDGKKTTTLNVTLKADKKNGYFGKVDGGHASDTYYQGQGMYNAFRTKQKFAGYATVGNTGRTGLNIQDNNRFGTTPGVPPANQSDLLESFQGRYNGDGLPEAQTGGMHYDAKWHGDKQSVNINFRIGSINVKSERSSLSQNNLPSGFINSNSIQTGDNTFHKQKADIAYQLTMNSTSTLKITADASTSTGETNTDYRASRRKDDINTLNTQYTRINNEEDLKMFNMSALWMKKLKKPGQTTSLLVAQSYSESNTNGYLYSLNNFYNAAGSADSTRLVDQYKPSEGQTLVLTGTLTYTHPFSKALSVSLNYGLNFYKTSLDNRSYNRSAPGVYNLPDNLFSNNFSRNLLSNQAGAMFTYAKKKMNIRFGTGISMFDDRSVNITAGTALYRKYVNWSPGITYRYQFSQQRDVFFQYGRSTRQPTVGQLQPINVNTDPLNIILGNPVLKPYNSNAFILIYQGANLIGDGYLIDLEYFTETNPVINSIITDLVGKSTYRYVNLIDRATSKYYIFISKSTRFKTSDIRTSFTLSSAGGTSYNLSNNVLNRTTFHSFTTAFAISKSAARKYSTSLSYTPGYGLSKSSLQKQLNNNGWTNSANGSFTLFIPGKIQISSTANYLFQGKTETFSQNFDRLLLNASLAKKFLKKESLSLTLSGNDLLNQNTGFIRNMSGSNMFTESQYTTIRRYAMLSLIWDFTKPTQTSSK